MPGVNVSRPPFNPDIAAVIEALSQQIDMRLLPETLATARERTLLFTEDLSGFDVDRRDLTIPGFDGVEIALTVFTPRGIETPAPCIFNIHSGGMVMGDRLTSIAAVLPWALEHGAVLTTVEYRLAPEFPDPVPVEDCYAALQWVSENPHELGIDPNRIIVTGTSAGAGLAAGITLMARDRKGPHILSQILIYPMLDDRDSTVSTLQFDGVGLWDRESNSTGWDALLGNRRRTDDVSIYAAPARAADLSNLPPTYVEVASAEVFRDECVAYASTIWEHGGVAELHVWPGGTHGFDVISPDSRIAHQTHATRASWIHFVLDDPETAVLGNGAREQSNG